MATYNTAFGTLPGYKDMLGLNNTTAGGVDDEEELKKKQAQQQAQQQYVQTGTQYNAQTPTFADLQKQGQARPAPPTEEAAKAPPMLSQLQQQLGSNAQAPGLPQPTEWQAEAPPPSTAQVYGTVAAKTPSPLVSQLQQQLGVAAQPPAAASQGIDTQADKTNTFTDSNGQQWVKQSDGTWTPTLTFDVKGYGRRTRTAETVKTDPKTGLPYVNAMNEVLGAYLPEDVYQAANGVTWVKRNGQWAVEGGNEQLKGYNALTPSELLQQNNAGAKFRQGFSGSGLDVFMQQYGTPATDQQWTDLANESGMSVDALKKIVADNRRRYSTQQELSNIAEEKQWKAANGVGSLPYNYKYVPASEGGPGIRMMTYEEVVAAGYQPYGGKALYNSAANQKGLAETQGYLDLGKYIVGGNPWAGTTTGTTGGTSTGTSNLVSTLNDLIGKTSIEQTGPSPKIATQTGPGPNDIGFDLNDPNGPWIVDGDNWTTVDGQPYPKGPDAANWHFVNGKWYRYGNNMGSNLPVGPSGPLFTPDGTPTGVPTSWGGTPNPGIPYTGPSLTGVKGPTPADVYNYMGTGADGSLGVKPNLGKAPGQFAIGQGTLDVQQQLRDMLTKLQNAPSPYEQEAYKKALETGTANLQAQYGAQKSALEEELARRGLSASTFGAGRYGDLAGQQARALATMQSDLLQKAASEEAQRQQVVMQGLGSLGQQMSSQDIAQYNANLENYKVSGQLELDAARLQQEAAIQGKSLSLQAARDQAQAVYQTQSLQNQLAEISARQSMAQQQSSANLLGQLLGQLDLSNLSQEQLNSLLSPYGINLGKAAVTGPGGTTPPTTPKSTPIDQRSGDVDYDYETTLGPSTWGAPGTNNAKPRSWNGTVYEWRVDLQRWTPRGS